MEPLSAVVEALAPAICAEVARARTGYPTPRPGEDAWWVRTPESGRLRSCRGKSGAVHRR